jgi:hypothetical protein
VKHFEPDSLKLFQNGVLTGAGDRTYIPPTDGDALHRSPLTSVFSSFSGRAKT